jgi:hypothetical protein
MRARTPLLAALIGLVLALTGAFAPVSDAGADASNPAADEAAFVAGVNAARARVGVAPLKLDGQLTSLARGWAEQMAAAGKISHASPISAGVTAPWLKLGENVGTGPAVDPVMQALINSPGHYANIVDPEFTRIGVGVVWGADGRLYTTHRFMKLAADTASAPAPASTDDGSEAPVAPAPRRVAPKPAAAPALPVFTLPTFVPPPAPPERVAAVLGSLLAAGR